MTTKDFEKIGLTLEEILKKSNLNTIKDVYGDLLITTSKVYAYIAKDNSLSYHQVFIELEPGTPGMLLSASIHRQEANLLFGDKELLVTNVSKLAYLEHGDSLSGLSLCITGKLKHVRDYYETLIKYQGGTFKKSITSTVNYLIAGRDVGSSKLNKAKRFNIPIIDEKEFHKLIIDRKSC